MRHPPADALGKVTNHVVEHIVPGDLQFPVMQSALKHPRQVFLKIPHEDLSALTGKDPLNIGTTVMQMIKDMRNFPAHPHFFGRKVVGFFPYEILGENMLENLSAQRAQQVVLCFKVRIKGAPPDVRLVDDLLHSDIAVGLCFKKLCKRLEHSLSCFFLSSIHCDPPGLFPRFVQ